MMGSRPRKPGIVARNMSIILDQKEVKMTISTLGTIEVFFSGIVIFAIKVASALLYLRLIFEYQLRFYHKAPKFSLSRFRSRLYQKCSFRFFIPRVPEIPRTQYSGNFPCLE